MVRRGYCVRMRHRKTHLTEQVFTREHAAQPDDSNNPGRPMVGNRDVRTIGYLALLWQNLAIDWRNWIPESDFQ